MIVDNICSVLVCWFFFRLWSVFLCFIILNLNSIKLLSNEVFKRKCVLLNMVMCSDMSISIIMFMFIMFVLSEL